VAVVRVAVALGGDVVGGSCPGYQLSLVATVLAQGWAVSGPLVARQIAFNGPRKHSGKIFKSEISSNLSQ